MQKASPQAGEGHAPRRLSARGRRVRCQPQRLREV